MTTADAPVRDSPSETILGLAPWTAALALVGAATLLRLGFLFLSPLQLYPDEAQYWVWSRHLAFGYFSKPPMIAWLIRATTAIGGDGEPWIRLSAPLLHGGAALALARAAKCLYGARAGFWTAAFYTLIPGVLLSSAIMSTDGPLLLFLSLAMWAYAAFWTSAEASGRRRAALALGVALGFAFLTKYAALYIAGGIALHAAVSPTARRRWDPATIALYLGAGLVVAAPNLLWNLAHHFQTIAHTADNADLGDERNGKLKGLIGPRGPFGFLFGQFGVFGPIAFAVLIAGVTQVVRRRGRAEDTLLVCLAAPAFVVVLLESIIARANANWAGAGYAPAIMLVAGLLARWRARRTIALGVAVQGLLFAGFFAGVLIPGLADAIGAGPAFKRARGWRESADAVVAAARIATRQAPLTAVAVDDRFLFNALSYYARDAAGRPAGALPAPLKAWIHLAGISNQAEAEAPLTVADGRRVFAASNQLDYLPAFLADFEKTTPAEPPRVLVRLDPRHNRRLDLFVGEGFAPRPRDPRTGRPRLP
jgi:4-amino-4-deoxy-L-arabinose transferase-like glycosyltransferase